MNASVTDPFATADAAAARLRELTGVDSHDVALVMGSGWAPAAEALGAPEAEFLVTELPGFPPAAVEGHGGKIRSYKIGDKRALVFLGRTHYYEGRGVAAVAHGVRTAVAAGCKTVVLTNGCGGLREGMKPGQPVLISDHLNLTATSPIVGANFVDLTDLYSPRLRAMCKEIDATLEEGVYVQFPGPHYETPAEINMIRVMGADLVGMSTVLEAGSPRPWVSDPAGAVRGVPAPGGPPASCRCAGLRPSGAEPGLRPLPGPVPPRPAGPGLRTSGPTGT
ncbi:purine-nucleoside phosphorylase [Streptomyces avidinii]